MKKNLMIAMLFASILMVSVVSAGITGYSVSLRRGVAVSDDNLGTVSVREVSGDTATFTFTDPNTGAIETLSGTEGQTVTTSSGTRVEIAEVTEGSVFRRGVTEINVVPASGLGVGASAGGVSGVVTGAHTHLSDFYTQIVEFSIPPAQVQGAFINQGVPMIVSGAGSGWVNIKDRPWYNEDTLINENTKVKEMYFEVFCNKNEKGDVALGGGQAFAGGEFSYADDLDYNIVNEGPINPPYLLPATFGNSLNTVGGEMGVYVLKILEPFTDVNGDNIDDEGYSGGTVWVTCARIEPTLHQFSQDY